MSVFIFWALIFTALASGFHIAYRKRSNEFLEACAVLFGVFAFVSAMGYAMTWTAWACDNGILTTYHGR